MTVHRSSGCPGWNVGCTNNDDSVEVSVIMRALDPEVMDAMWVAAEPLLPWPNTAVMIIRWAVTILGSRTGCALRGS